MPRSFSIVIATIMGYLNGAGLGALSIDLLSSHAAKELNTTLVALIITGPLGALFALLVVWLRQGREETAPRAEAE